MSKTIYSKLVNRRGMKDSLPSLDYGEFGFCGDTDQIFAGIKSNEELILAAKSKTVTVGSEGDYPTINAALESLSRKKAIHNTGAVTVRLLSGFIMEEQVKITTNLSWVVIESAAAEVVVRRSALTVAPGRNNPSMYPAFFVTDGGISPLINVLFSMDSSGAATGRYGFYVEGSGHLSIAPDKGCKGAPRGLWVCGAGVSADCDSGIFTGSAEYGITARHGGRINANYANVSNSGRGIGSYSGASIACRDINAQNCTVSAVVAVTSGKIYARFANASGSAIGGFAAGNAIFNAPDFIAENCTGRGLFGHTAGYISASRAQLANCDTGMYIENGSWVSANSSDVTNCTMGALIRRGSHAHLRESDFSGCTTGIEARHASIVDAHLCNMNNTGVGFRTTHGAWISATDVTTVGSTTPFDVGATNSLHPDGWVVN